jgi:2-succinyl-6-hydroxy-2,4-cyclohexadiene-1-carboxylate synthase
MRTVAVDLIGHGASDAPSDPDRYRVERCIEDLLAVLDALEISQAAVLGYSMGGRVALRFALAAPERVSALVLESASPGIEDAGERAARLESDSALALRIERDGLEAFIDNWESIPLWASQKDLPDAVRAQLRRQRLQNSPTGLANSLRGMSAGHEASVLASMRAIALPALLVAGDLDVKYTGLARQMAAQLHQVTTVIVPGAGHAVHLERPDLFSDVVRRFLADRVTVA